MVDDAVIVKDLRMGSEPFYVFSFKVARRDGSRTLPVNDERIWSGLSYRNGLPWVWQRIWRPMPKL